MWAREEGDTDDLVQDAFLKTLKGFDGFVPQHAGALQAYLRQAVINRIRDGIRRRAHRPLATTLDQAPPATMPSPLEAVIGRETMLRYESALDRLRPDDRALVVARVELGCSYEEMAESFDKPSINATRVALCRALARLAREMKT